MEQNNELIFDVISGDDEVILDVISKYNDIYKTDFTVLEFNYDEVVMAKIKVTKYEILNIFHLGYCFSARIEKKRQKGEINW
ncbi:hypothetical protein VB264_23630 [Arcicella aquatica]|uniref:Uncharacterized protein n=1 Tax=Arcicella aquatica TaxID=217141 RepID=A0ABU5QWV3_9BACT|nr:hypothetical protein [Arcicella aquatica]MEA5260811.1 hypothetical protein [Arcicella aquatica]